MEGGGRDARPEADRRGGTGRGANHHVSGPRIPACGLGQGGQDASMLGCGVQASSPENQSDGRHVDTTITGPSSHVDRDFPPLEDLLSD